MLQDKYVGTKAVAAELGITIGRVQQLIAAKRLPATKIGRDYLVKRTDIELVRIRKVGRPKVK